MAERLEFKGLPASPGIAVGAVLIYKREKASKQDLMEFNQFDSKREVARFAKALEETRKQVQMLREEAEQQVGKDAAAIFEAHLMILDDNEFSGKIMKFIRENEMSAEEAVRKVSEQFIQK